MPLSQPTMWCQSHTASFFLVTHDVKKYNFQAKNSKKSHQIKQERIVSYLEQGIPIHVLLIVGGVYQFIGTQ